MELKVKSWLRFKKSTPAEIFVLGTEYLKFFGEKGMDLGKIKSPFNPQEILLKLELFPDESWDS